MHMDRVECAPNVRNGCDLMLSVAVLIMQFAAEDHTICSRLGPGIWSVKTPLGLNSLAYSYVSLTRDAF